MEARPERRVTFREGVRMTFSDKPRCQTEREVRNLFIALSYSGPRLSLLKPGDVIWTREADGNFSEYTKRTLSHVAKGENEIRLYWDNDHYWLTVEKGAPASRVFLVDDEARLIQLAKQYQQLFKCS